MHHITINTVSLKSILNLILKINTNIMYIVVISTLSVKILFFILDNESFIANIQTQNIIVIV